MAQQAVRLVLGQDGDPADVRIEAVRQREIDDAELAAKENRGLGAAVGQLFQPAAAAAGEDERERAPRQSFLDASRREHEVLLPSIAGRPATPASNSNAQGTASVAPRRRMFRAAC